MAGKPSGKNRLGRGLSALIPAQDEPGDDSTAPRRSYFLCPLNQIVAMRQQPRQRFDQKALEELAESIRNDGLLQPLVVRPGEDGMFHLVAGERRLRASRLAGLSDVPVVVRDVSDRHAFTLALIENIQREDLNPLEEAEAFRQLIEDFELTHEEAARKVGKSRAAISNTLRLLQLPEEVRDHVVSGELSAGHARAILSALERWRGWLSGKVLSEQLSVRKTEALARKTHEEGFNPLAPKEQAEPEEQEDGALRTANVKDAERRLRQIVGHKVRIKRKKDRSGTIEIPFTDDTTLQSIVDILLELED